MSWRGFPPRWHPFNAVGYQGWDFLGGFFSHIEGEGVFDPLKSGSIDTSCQNRLTCAKGDSYGHFVAILVTAVEWTLVTGDRNFCFGRRLLTNLRVISMHVFGRVYFEGTFDKFKVSRFVEFL